MLPGCRSRVLLKLPSQLENREQAHIRPFDSITSFLKSVARWQTLMLVLDDLQWADQRFLTSGHKDTTANA